MLRYKTETRPGLVALYDIRPGNGAGQFLQLRSLHGANRRKDTSVYLHGILQPELELIKWTVQLSLYQFTQCFQWLCNVHQDGNVIRGFTSAASFQLYRKQESVPKIRLLYYINLTTLFLTASFQQNRHKPVLQYQIIFPSVLRHCGLGDRKGSSLGVGLLLCDDDDLTAALHVLQLQFSPQPSSLAPIKSRMDSFWYWLSQVHLENGH